MTDADLIAAFMAKKGATQCAPATKAVMAKAANKPRFEADVAAAVAMMRDHCDSGDFCQFSPAVMTAAHAQFRAKR